MSTVSGVPTAQQLLIGGAWRDAGDGRTHDVIGAGEQPVTRQAAASAADARAAADAAAAALPAWAATAPSERRDLLAKAGELLASRIEGEPLPLEGDLADALDPARFALKQVRRGTL